MMRRCRQHDGLLASLLASVAILGCAASGDQPASDPAGSARAAEPQPRDGAAASGIDRASWPTEDEAKAAIFKVEYAIHASQTNKDVWHVKDMRHDVHSVRFADHATEKQMDYGRGAITVYPAKILYTRITEYADKEATREEIGAGGVWFLYKDSFGDWTGKYATE